MHVLIEKRTVNIHSILHRPNRSFVCTGWTQSFLYSVAHIALITQWMPPR